MFNRAKEALFTLFIIAFAPYSAEAYAIKVTDFINNPVEDVVIALIPDGPILPMHDQKTNISQIDYMFEPRIKVIQTGTTVHFPNYDPVHHNVYSFSKTKKFSISLYKEEKPQITFDAPGIITLACNIHDWMLGYIIVLNTSYYGVTNETGIVNIENVPEGSYTLQYWHPSVNAEEGIQTYHHSVNVQANSFSLIPLNVNKNVIWPEKPQIQFPEMSNSSELQNTEDGMPAKEQKNKKHNSPNMVPYYSGTNQ